MKLNRRRFGKLPNAAVAVFDDEDDVVLVVE
jgi:hypothetical protein